MAQARPKITLSSSRDIPFDKLVLSQSNVRRIKAGVAIEELAEDIARRTLLQSLTVRPVVDADGQETGLYEVPSGGRRFRALERLVKAKRLARNAPIPCVIRTEGIAEEDTRQARGHGAPARGIAQGRRAHRRLTEDVYDSWTGKVLLIPQGARLVGQYDAQIQFGQSRALLAWTRLILPNGRSIVLERQPGADPQGYAGLADQVDNHWGQLFRAAMLSTLLSVGTEAGTANNENSLVQAIREGASNSFAQVGSQVIGRSLGVQPTIMIRPGFPVRVIVTRDLVLEPYQG